MSTSGIDTHTDTHRHTHTHRHTDTHTHTHTHTQTQTHNRHKRRHTECRADLEKEAVLHAPAMLEVVVSLERLLRRAHAQRERLLCQLPARRSESKKARGGEGGGVKERERKKKKLINKKQTPIQVTTEQCNLCGQFSCHRQQTRRMDGHEHTNTQNAQSTRHTVGISAGVTWPTADFFVLKPPEMSC